MPCLPESGGCEKPFTDFLVAHLNRVEGTHYMHRACLDMADKTTPQPEALYVDPEIGRQLVIERKSISWPVDYPYRHKNDHAVGELFAQQLRDLTVDDLYEIRLPMLMEGKRTELLSYAGEATKQIRANWSAIASGQGLKGHAGNKWWWAFSRLPEWDREDNAPSRGIKVTLVGPGLSFDDFLDPDKLPEALVSAIDKIYAGCSAKFASYPEARRILLLDPHGDLQTESTDWWQKVWASMPPPLAIGEIWSGILEWITDDTQDWGVRAALFDCDRPQCVCANAIMYFIVLYLSAVPQSRKWSDSTGPRIRGLGSTPVAPGFWHPETVTPRRILLRRS